MSSITSNNSKQTSDTVYRKHFIPLESNPDVFNDLIGLLGAPPSLTFQDVLSLDDPSLLPRRALALILVFPTSDSYEARKAIEDGTREDHNDWGKNKEVMWFKQTINNACGFYGILHALANGEAREVIKPNSLLARIMESCSLLPPHERSLVLEDSEELEEAYKKAAMQGSSRVPDDPEDEVDFHYVCFVRSQTDGRLYELDGDRKGPIDRGPVDDLLDPSGLNIIREYIELEQGNMYFGLMALCFKDEAAQS